MLKISFLGLKDVLYAAMFAFLLIGCSTKTLVGQAQWVQNDIKVDGIVQDWPQTSPLYYDEDNRMSVQMLNDNKFLYFYISVVGENLKKGLVKDGLTLTFEPVGMAVSPLKISFKDHRIMKVFHPSELAPVLMSAAETREKGIEVKMRQVDRSAMIFEAKIGFVAIYPPTGILSGTHLIVKIESTRMEIFEEFSSGESIGRSGGGRGGGRGGRGGGAGRSGGMKSAEKREEVMEPFEATLEVVLATDAF